MGVGPVGRNPKGVPPSQRFPNQVSLGVPQRRISTFSAKNLGRFVKETPNVGGAKLDSGRKRSHMCAGRKTRVL